MTRWTGILLVAWMLPSLASFQTCTKILESGSSGYATFNVYPTNYFLLDWKMIINGDEVDISRCNALDKTCVDEYPDEYQASVKARRDKSTGIEYYESSLKIDQATIAMSEVQLRNGPYLIGNCPLRVFVKPNKPTCDPPEFINANEQIKVTCRTDQVYPQAECDFYHSGPDEGHIPISLSFIHDQSETTSLYSTECSCTIDTKEINPGERYQFYVEVYPDVQDGKNFSVFSDNTSSISYVPPKVTRFTANGATGSLVVDEGSDVTFVCEATSDPNATLTLYQKGYRLFDMADVEDSNTLRYTEKNINCEDSDVYICRATNGQIATEEVEVYVKCALELEKESDNNSVYSPDEEGDVKVDVDVTGYPSPVTYSLKLAQNSTQQPIERQRFMVRYTNSTTSLSLYTISLTLLDYEPEQGTSYLLTVDNGVGANKLNFHFFVAMEHDSNVNRKTTAAVFSWFPVVLSVAGGLVVAIAFAIAAYVWYRRNSSPQPQPTTEEHDDPGVELEYNPPDPSGRDSPPSYHSIPYDEVQETCV